MKQKHILNIGLAKCGTSWLWEQLKHHPDVNLADLQKEPTYFFETNNIDEYIKSFENFDISANFYVTQWAIDQCLIQDLDKIATHVSIIFSDPYLFIERFYNWLPKNMEKSEFIDMCINTKHICYKEITDRWRKNLSTDKFKILIYDDLNNKPIEFLSEYFSFCGLRNVTIPGFDKVVNKNSRPKVLLTFSDNQIKTINSEITKFEQLVGRDFGHWYR